jgi:sulfur-oxidizing protein SoxY
MIKELFFWLFACAVVYSHYTMYVQADEVDAEGIYAQYLNVEPGDMKGKSSDDAWELRKPDRYRNVEMNTFGRIQLRAPFAAEDATIVPIQIKVGVNQHTNKHDIKRISIYIDKNPDMHVATFNFTSLAGKAELYVRVRVNENSFIRAIAETTDGRFWESKSFVRARGACSAPPPVSIEDSKSRIGKMKLKVYGLRLNKPTLVKLQIYHPQITGFQPVRLGGGGIPPAYYINTITASFNGKKIFNAETGYAISMDPAIGFYFVPDGVGTLKITATDTKGNIYEHLHELGGS